MIGAIIGDIVGSIYEFDNIRTTDFELFSKRSHYTDDTVCTVALMDWLLHSEVKDDKTATEYLHRWVRRYPYAGYGGRFYKWMKSENPQPYGSYGNGSAMRISPIGYVAKDLEELKYLSDTATEVSHNHPEGMKGALVIATLIYMAKHGSDMQSLKDYAISMYKEIETLDYEDLRKNYGFYETCQESVPQAIYCFLISNSFEDCIRKTISIGGDCDTTAAMSGAIAEAYYGIPQSIIDQVIPRLSKEMRTIVEEFYNTYK